MQQRIARVGLASEEVATKMMATLLHPQQAFRAILGLLQLGQTHGHEHLEKACERALGLGSCRYRGIASILKHHLEERPLRDNPAVTIPHDNIRGGAYYDAPPTDQSNPQHSC